MKILIDPVYTGKVHKCSTSYLAWELIEQLSQWRDDVFFYLLYPKAAEASDDEMAFLLRHKERVTLLPYPYLQGDRVEEIFKFSDELLHYLAPGDAPTWDYDVVLSSRIQQLTFMRNVSGREAVNYPHGTQRLFLGLEEMPMFNFRKTVAWSGGGNMDLQGLAAYANSGGIIMNNLWTKKMVTQTAREYLAPSQVMKLANNIHECVPIQLTRLDIGETREVKDSFNVVFTGRMTNTRNFQGVVDVFRKHFSFPLGKGDVPLKFIVSTNSLSTGTIDPGEMDFIDVQMNDRPKFHALLKQTAHVVVNLSEVEDFSLSTYEPLLFGVPVIVPTEPWTDFLGKSYPFRAKNPTDAYALVKLFALDYAGQMEKFRQWEETYWAEFISNPKTNVTTAETLINLVQTHEAMLQARIEKKITGDAEPDSFQTVVNAILKADLKEVNPLLFAREMDPPYFITNAKQWKGIPIGKRPLPYFLKLYMQRAGYEDTNEPGVMRRK